MLATGSFRDRLWFALQRAKGISIETNIKTYRRIVGEIRAFDLTSVGDDELARRAGRLRRKAESGESLDVLLPEAYAVVAESCRRELGQSPYDVQLIAAVVLHRGKVAQMKTGEGKTLAAVFPSFLNALCGRGVHVLTANDYLARRDAEWMGGVLRRLGVSTGWVTAGSSAARRRAAYRLDVTYLTARQAGFDFLSDALAYDAADLVQREAGMAIVDEADFILIDEARIPLVIAADDEAATVDALRADNVARALCSGRDYTVDRAGRNCILTLSGQRRVEEMMGCGGMHEESSRNVFAAVHVALHAHHLLERDVDYIVRAGRIQLVDGFTGRVAQSRRWPFGIQTALEIKEGVEVRREGRIAGSITVRNLIRRYPRLAAMTATAVPAAGELAREYGLSTVVIPPFRTEQAVHLSDRVFATREAKTEAVIDEVVAEHATGRPILVGTRSVRESEDLSRRFRSRGIACQVLNARNDRREAGLVARAGMLGCVTIATNMAGRGTDVKLGGEEGVQRARIESLGGLYVIGTNRHESVRVDDQLRGRAGRQGDPGLTCFFVSLEDELFRKYGVPEFLPRRSLAANRGGELTDRRVSREIGRAQAIIEEQYSQMRRTLSSYSELVELERREVEAMRREALVSGAFPAAYYERCSARLAERPCAGGRKLMTELMRRSLLLSLDGFWSDHLAYVDELREGIHLQRYARREPLLVFIKEVSDAFERDLGVAIDEAADRFLRFDLRRVDPHALSSRLRGPASTWTYMVNDDPFPPFSLSMLARADLGAAAIMALQAVLIGPFVLLAAGVSALLRRMSRPHAEESMPEGRVLDIRRKSGLGKRGGSR